MEHNLKCNHEVQILNNNMKNKEKVELYLNLC